MSIEQQIEKLEKEMKSLKTSFEQSASTVDIFTTETNFSTSSNVINVVQTGTPPGDPSQWWRLYGTYNLYPGDNSSTYREEPVIVTFRSFDGSNCYANIETDLSSEKLFTANRIPFSGGARWRILISPNVTQQTDQGGRTYYTWATTNFKIAVQSAVKGTLEVKMAWE